MNKASVLVTIKWWLAVVLLTTLLPSAGLSADNADRNEQLRKAAEDGNLAVVKSLVENGADVHAVTRDGVTILMNAAIGGNLEVVEFLVGQGLDVNAKTSNGDFSVLLWASLAGNLKVVGFLIDKGADINAKDSHGNTILALANLWGRTEVAKYLKSRGAK